MERLYRHSQEERPKLAGLHGRQSHRARAASLVSRGDSCSGYSFHIRLNLIEFT